MKANWASVNVWTRDQYDSAQKVLGNLKDSAFDTWDESRLREFLLEQGVVAPSGPREKLVLAAKQQYRAYTNAASSYASSASDYASTAVYGDASYQRSKSVSSLYTQATDSASSVAAQATTAVVRAADDSKDYIYSTWDDNKLRSYLEGKGVIKTKQQATRDQLLAYMKDTFTQSTDSVWQAWSDSYIVCFFIYRLPHMPDSFRSTSGSSRTASSSPTTRRGATPSPRR